MIPEGKALGLMVMVLILLLFAVIMYLMALPTILEGKGFDLKKLRVKNSQKGKK